MTGQIPKYGKRFRRERVAYDPHRRLASRRYVLKANEKIFIQATPDSEHWTVYVAGPAGAAFPVGDPSDTFSEAMPRAIALAGKI